MYREEIIKYFNFYTELFNKEKITVGMVGYPNVGKSSLINVLLGINMSKVRCQERGAWS